MSGVARTAAQNSITAALKVATEELDHLPTEAMVNSQVAIAQALIYIGDQVSVVVDLMRAGRLG